MPKIAKDTPLVELTLRRYEKPAATDRELVRRLCLSLGLLQPGDSRDVVVDIFYALLKAKAEREPIHAEEIRYRVVTLRKNIGLPMLGIASSNVRRQLRRLKELHLIESQTNLYRITEWATLTDIFEEKIKGFLIESVLGRVKEYVKKVDDEFHRDDHLEKPDPALNPLPQPTVQPPSGL